MTLYIHIHQSKPPTLSISISDNPETRCTFTFTSLEELSEYIDASETEEEKAEYFHSFFKAKQRILLETPQLYDDLKPFMFEVRK